MHRICRPLCGLHILLFDGYPVGVYNNYRRSHKKGDIKMEQCELCRTKERSPQEYKSLINRLNRIEGQVRGIRGMVEKSAYCVDILTQVAAARAALDAFNRELLANHIKSCVAEDIKAGGEEKTDELIAILQKLMK